MGDMAWGTHVCAFYEGEQDVLDMLVAYFKAGIEAREFCVWALSNPITERSAVTALRKRIPQFDKYLRAGSIEFLPDRAWYLSGDQVDFQRITNGWWKKLDDALAKGYEGMRISGNAFWIGTDQWTDFCDYEREFDRAIAGRNVLALCTYALHASRAIDLLDVARAHQFTLARRHGKWEFLSTPELVNAKNEITRLNAALDVMTKSFPGSERLTATERSALAYIVRGASAKETARALGVSPRTVEFHRANIMQKLRVKNTTELVFRALSE